MAKSSQNPSTVEEIKQLKWSGLRKLWKSIALGEAPLPAGKALEHLVLRAFQLDKAVVTWPYDVSLRDIGGDGGTAFEQIDGVLYFEHFECLVECKDYSDNVGPDAVAKLRNQLLRRPGRVVGAIFCRRGYTDAAVALARFAAPASIVLWTGDDIRHALDREAIRGSFVQKYRYLVERGVPIYNTAGSEV